MVGRPRAEDPRSELLRFRATVGERSRIEALAAAAGVRVSDFLRSCALGGEAEQVGPTVAQKLEARRVVAEAKPAMTRWERRQVEAMEEDGPSPVAPSPGFRCPFGPGRCSFVAPSGRARCPVHGRSVVAR